MYGASAAAFISISSTYTTNARDVVHASREKQNNKLRHVRMTKVADGCPLLGHTHTGRRQTSPKTMRNTRQCRTAYHAHEVKASAHWKPHLSAYNVLAVWTAQQKCRCFYPLLCLRSSQSTGLNLVMLACSRLGAVWQTVYKTRHLCILDTVGLSLSLLSESRVSQSCRLRGCCRTLAGAC